MFFFGIHSGWIPKSYVYDNFLRLATASIILSFSISIFVYFKAKISPKALLAVGGNSGNIIYDFFIGHELNPRIGNFDLKYFCELRPGLIGWAILNFGFAAKQYELNNNLGLGMILVCLYQCVYVLDALYMESSILTTMDITTEGFGFMLAFGDLSWVPFTYSTQARFLATRADPINSNFFLFLVIVFLQVFGYWIFRGSNNEKNTFRTDPNSPFVKRMAFP